jgi:hypothetical protein
VLRLVGDGWHRLDAGPGPRLMGKRLMGKRLMGKRLMGKQLMGSTEEHG